jgi:transposase InsO family protein
MFPGIRRIRLSQPDACLEHYCERRIKKPLGWMSPTEYRKSLGCAL